MTANVSHHNSELMRESPPHGEFKRILKLVRSALSGSIIGIAVFGVLAAAIGVNVNMHLQDLIGAITGFLVVIALETRHLL